MKHISQVILALLFCAGADHAFADWACATPAQLKPSLTKGQSLEKSGKLPAALSAYLAAQANACDGNSIAIEATKRAAAIAKPLGDAETAKGNLEAAFNYYEQGGHFKAADQALIAWTAAQPDDPELYDRARIHFEHRTLPAFAENMKTQLAVTGAYSLESSFVIRVKNMPATAVERALRAEATAFSDAYIQRRIALTQSRPDSPLDFAANQQFLARAQAFATQYPKDPLQTARDALSLVQRWASKTTNAGEPEAFDKQLKERAQIRFAALTQKYSADPQLLGAATLLTPYLPGTAEVQAAHNAKVLALAEKLGDAAAAKKRFTLAADYYSVAGADDKQQRVNEQMQANAQQQMQPAIDDAKRSAANIAAQFGDPNKVAEMRRAAQQMQRNMQEGVKAKQSPTAKRSSDDMARELGL